jgi:predicted HicB family RNase H-like nuclease
MANVTETHRKSRSATAIRFPEELHEQLREKADEYEFSINYLVVKAVEDFLPRMIPAKDLKLTRE